MTPGSELSAWHTHCRGARSITSTPGTNPKRIPPPRPCAAIQLTFWSIRTKSIFAHRLRRSWGRCPLACPDVFGRKRSSPFHYLQVATLRFVLQLAPDLRHRSRLGEVARLSRCIAAQQMAIGTRRYRGICWLFSVRKEALRGHPARPLPECARGPSAGVPPAGWRIR